MGVARIQEMGAALIQEISAMKNFQVIAAARYFCQKLKILLPTFRRVPTLMPPLHNQFFRFQKRVRTLTEGQSRLFERHARIFFVFCSHARKNYCFLFFFFSLS